MQLHQTSPLNSDTRQLESQIHHDRRAQELGPERVSALRGVYLWKLLLTEKDKEKTEALQRYAVTVGGARELVAELRAARQARPEKIEKVLKSIVSDIHSGNYSESWPGRVTAERLKTVYSDLTLPQARLLQTLVTHRINIDSLDITRLSRALPFPIDEGGLLWRFLAGQADSPRHAARELEESIPFLVTMKNLLEGLSESPTNLVELILHGHELILAESADETYKPITSLINASHDLYGPQLARSRQKLRCLSLPAVPELNLLHIEEVEYPQLAQAMFSMLFFGDTNSEILKRVCLPKTREEQSSRLKENIAQLRVEIAELKSQVSEPQESGASRDDLSSQLEELQKTFRKRTATLGELEQERLLTRSVFDQLTANSYLTRQFENFQLLLDGVVKSGVRPVFVFTDINQQRAWVEMLDFAFGPEALAGRNEETRLGSLLQKSSFIFSNEVANGLRRALAGSESSYIRANLGRFDLYSEHYTLGIKRILNSFAPSRIPPDLEGLLSEIIAKICVPGITSQYSLISTAKRALQIKPGSRLGAEALFGFVCERATNISEASMLRMLDHLHRLKVTKIQQNIVDICEARFSLPRTLFDSFEDFARTYRPERWGQLGDNFEDLTSLKAFINSGLESLGMHREVVELEQVLAKSDFVAVVDSTDYYRAERGEQLSGPITSDAVCGEYFPPLDRLGHSLSDKIVRGEANVALRDSTVVIPQRNGTLDSMQQFILQILGGTVPARQANLTQIAEMAAKVAKFNARSILVLDAVDVKDFKEYSALLDIFKEFGLKAVFRTRVAFPGIKSVFVDPFPPSGLVDRVLAEPELLAQRLGLSSAPTRSCVELAVKQVKQFAKHGEDPLHLSLQVISGAAACAKALGESEINDRDIIDATARVFKLPSSEQFYRYVNGVKEFKEVARKQAFGQEEAIDALSSAMSSHLLRLKPETKPLVILLAGPTGTGKTMIANLLASNLDLPSLTLEGSQYNSESQISRLVGSAPDYRGPDEGKLFLHARDNPNALVFIDELEKMHRAFLPYLMNFYDKGTLEAGSGAVVHRPGITILLGTNAGAEQLRRGMSQREIKDILGTALGRGDGVNLDWFVARLQVIPMLAIDQESFKNAVRKNLDEIGSRFGVITANLRLQEVDDAACEILFDAVQEVCRFESESNFGANIGFDTGRAEKSFNSDSTFKDLRYLAQALDRLVGDSLQDLVIEQIDSGKNNERSKVSGFKLIGDRQSGTIKAKRLD